MGAKGHLSLALIVSAGALAAQPTMTVADGPQPDQMMTYSSSTFMPITATGPDAVWDLSAAQEMAGPDAIYFVAPDATGFEAQFPGATVATDDGTNFIFNRVAADGWYIMGQRVVASGMSFMAHYTDEQLVMPYPCTFNTAFADSFLYNYTVQGMLVNGSGLSDYTANGFGTLILPHGTIDNVLMLSGEFTTQEEIPGVISIRNEMDIVSFYKPGFPDYLAQTREIVQYQDGEQTSTASGLFYASEDVFTAIGGPVAQAIGVQAWPVPAATQVQVAYGLPGGRVADLQLVDMNGRTVRSMRDHTSASGIQVARMSVEGLPPGLYVLNLMDDRGQRGTCRVVVQ